PEINLPIGREPTPACLLAKTQHRYAPFQTKFTRHPTLMTKRTNIPGTSPFEPIIGFSRAVRIGNQIHVSGTGPVGADQADIAEQTNQCLTLIATALKNAGSSIEHIYRTRMYLTH